MEGGKPESEIKESLSPKLGESCARF